MKSFYIFSRNLVQLKSIIRQYAKMKSRNSIYIFTELCLLMFFMVWKLCPRYNFKNFWRHFQETLYKYKALEEKIQRTLTPPTLFTEFCPFIILNMETDTLHNFKTNVDIFTKYGTYIKYCQLMVRK